MKQDPSDKLIAEAVECYQQLIDPGADPKVRMRWVAWLADPEHRVAYEQVERTMRRPVPDGVWPSREELERDTYDPAMPVQEHLTRQQTAGRPVWWRLLSMGRVSAGLASVAAVLLAAVTTLYLTRQPGLEPPEHPVSYQTGRAEQRRIALADGSHITLGPLSELQLVSGLDGREARLLSGEALFQVAHDPDRPFEVSAGQGRVRDIGTAFSVAMQPDFVTVTVVDGSVSVALPGETDGGHPAVLLRDQQVSYAAVLSRVGPVDAAVATGWAQGRLAYIDRPLSEVVADLMRYSTVDISLADPAAGALRYTGTISPDAIDQWVATLAKVYPVQVERSGARLVLRAKPAN